MFAEYVKASGKRFFEWADLLGISRGHLSQIMNGNKTPSLELAVRIERLTEGAVPVASWVVSIPEEDAA